VADGSRPRETYHHGQLGPALVEAGLVLSRTSGARAIVLREATRMAGVTPRAAYRHFPSREALVDAVAAAALARMADVIQRHIDAVDPTAGGAAGRSVDVLRAVGRGYLEFALSEPGWFDVAFFVREDLAQATAGDAAGAAGRTPLQQLQDALDAMVATGQLAAKDRPGADLFCWSAVHGFAVLATRGPLRTLPTQERDRVADLVVELAVSGVAGQSS
jgi:AcrR family transcriptional regulator